ncbi:VOC family protein [Myxococcus sp. AM009]|uniref:VOC family protein n=1 Tax=unclassified Myxococcus TaxID=2648731 RepID=UPI001595F0B1|nr:MULTISPECIES: VOC family protein [unclassified Myxococcus]NVJ00817.1 VOC family protein [Myxococcus sp. AM009]NVJ16063.1 VOC family protein [Myxococcus sp. AM010]
MPSASPGVRGIDHVGITVPDLNVATAFFIEALGAEVLYDSLEKGQPPQEGADLQRRLRFLSGSSIRAMRMLRLGNGASIELFEYTAPEQRPPARPNDLGIQHLAVYVDDMDAARARFQAAGGEVFSSPHELPALEQGPGNAFCYARAPWGTLIELITYPSPQPYEQQTALRRWKPPQRG